MKCRDEGRLLLYLDKELAAQEMQEIEAHLASCPQCARCLQELEKELGLIADKLGTLRKEAAQLEVSGESRVWDAVKRGLKFRRKGIDFMKIRKMAVAAVLLVALGLVVSVPSLRMTAANWLQVFRAEKVDTLVLSPQDINEIENAITQGNGKIDIDNFGKMLTIGEYEFEKITPEQFNKLTFTPRLPQELNNDQAEFTVENCPAMQFSPDVKNLNQLLTSMGGTCLLPKELQGQSFTVKMGEMLSTQCQDYRLMQGPASQVEVPAGVDVKEVINAMLSLPIWPDNVKQQLVSIDWEHSLVIPGDRNAKKVRVNGASGVLMGDPSSRCLIWQDNGILFILEDLSQGNVNLLDLANSLR